MIRSRRRWATATVWVLCTALGAGAGFLAGRATFVPPKPAVQAAPQQTFVVSEATIGSTLDATATLSWKTTPLGTGGPAGTVTSLSVADGDTVTAGDVLYSVDLRPVVVAKGDVPAFRELAIGTAGADVRQLETFLSAAGHFTAKPDEQFTGLTATAVRRWQADLGVKPTGVVAAGDLVFVSTLPARVVLDKAVAVGATTSGGGPVVHSVAREPEVLLYANREERSVVPTTGSRVDVHAESGTWETVAAETVRVGDDETRLRLTAPDGGPACGKACADLTFTRDELTIPASFIVIPETTGPAVPLSALATAADGSTYVLALDGERIPVTVEISDGSRAIVHGVETGTTVRLFAIEEPATDGAADPSGPAGQPSVDPAQEAPSPDEQSS